MKNKIKWLIIPLIVLFLSACSNMNLTQESSPSYETMDMAVEQSVTDSNIATRESTDGRDIIYTASVDYQTVRYDEAKQSIITIIEENGGIIQYQDEYVNDYRYQDIDQSLTSLYLTIRVPQDQYEGLLTALENNDQAQLMQISRGSQDVTKQVQDLEIRIESIDNRIERLNELNEQAETIADLIEIQTALEEAITERDLLLSQQSDLSDEVDNATINVSLREVIELSDRSESQLTFWDRVVAALGQTWQNSIDAFEWGILTLIFLIPYLIFIVILFLIIRYIISPIFRRIWKFFRRNKTQKKEKIIVAEKENSIKTEDEIK